jgi:citrate synthase
MPEFVPGLAGVPAAESKICFIDGAKGILEYRGYRIEDLAAHTTFEETAYLLIRGELPTHENLERFQADLARHRRLKYKIIDLLKCLPETGHPMDALDAAVAALGMFYPSKAVTSPEVQYISSVRLIAKLPTITAAYNRMRSGDNALRPRDDLGHAANFLWIMFEREPDPFLAHVLDVCLILHAEHSMNASTFSARVTGSTLADPFSVISAAISTLAGPLHGGANEDVIGLLGEIGGVDNVVPFVERRIKDGRKFAGFGHRIYKTTDPRAEILRQLASQVCDRMGGSKLFDIARATEKAVTERLGDKGVWANVDFYSGIVYANMGIPSDAFTPIFAIARVAGWLAHWIEQVGNVNRIYRPGQIYIGERERKFVAIGQRG